VGQHLFDLLRPGGPLMTRTDPS